MSNRITLCKIYVSVEFVNTDGVRASDQFVMDIIFQSKQRMFDLVKKEVLIRNDNVKSTSSLYYYLLSREYVTPKQYPFEVEE